MHKLVLEQVVKQCKENRNTDTPDRSNLSIATLEDAVCDLVSQSLEYKTLLIGTNRLLLRATKLLKVAICPACDGSGGIPTNVLTAEYETDSGTQYESEVELEQCQWCDEKNIATSREMGNNKE